MTSPVQIHAKKTKDMVETLKHLLETAEQGSLRGLVVACKINGVEKMDHYLGAFGDYRTDSIQGIGVAGRLYHLLNDRIDSEEEIVPIGPWLWKIK